MSGNQLIISNFRSWRNNNYIDLSSINLLLGANSSGKSSIIHALALLKQSELSHRLIPNGIEIDLGRIEDQVNFKAKSKPQTKRELSDFIGFGLKYQLKSFDILRSLRRNRPLDYRPLANRISRSETERLSQSLASFIGDLEYLERFDDLGLIKDITLLSRSQKILFINIKKRSRSKIWISLEVTKDPDYWENFIDLSGENRLSEEEEISKRNLLETNEKKIKTLMSNVNSIRRKLREEKIKSGKNFTELSNEYRNLQRNIFAMRREIRELEDSLVERSIPGGTNEEKCAYISSQLSQTIDMDIEDVEEIGVVNLLSTISTHYRNFRPNSDDNPIGEMIDLLHKNSKFELTVHPLLMLSIVHNRFEQITSSVVRIGPHRERPDRVSFVNPNDKNTFVGTQGENVMSIINQISRKQINELNEWCKLLGIPYNLTRKRFKQFNISQLILKDEEGMSVSLADVGYGIGQVLPIILTSMLTRNTIITIEQPELHLHPKLQANLADLFIRSASTLNNNFILETHSEHIILRMKRRQKEARETRLDQGIKKQKSSANTVFELNQKPRYRSFPSNIGDFEMAKWISIRDSVVISVIDTPKNKSESEFSKITLNSGGDFDTHWPGDFFPERYKELGLEDDF